MPISVFTLNRLLLPLVGRVALWSLVGFCGAGYSEAEAGAELAAGSGSEVSAAPLTATEAARLVRAEENAKRTAVLDEFERLDARPALDRSVLDLGERGIFYNRTAPAAPRVFAPPFLRSTETAEAASATDSALEDDEASARPRHFLMLSATVYEGGITELRWSREGRDFHAFSPINFLLFSGIGEFATAQADYDYFMAVSAESLLADSATATATPDLLAARVPANAVLLQRPAGYFVVQATSSQPEPLAAAVPDSTLRARRF